MDNTVIRRLCNLLLRSYFLSSLDLCSFICKMKELEDNFRAFVRIQELAAGLISLSLCTPSCLPAQVTHLSSTFLFPRVGE